MPSDVLITPASSKVEFTDGNNATKTLRITGTSFSFNSDLGIGITSPTSKLNVLSTTSLSSVFKAEGVNGTLFEVTDDLSNSLMSVNTIGGLPVFEVFANNTIVAGQYNANDFVISGNKVGVGTASPGTKLEVVGAIRGGLFSAGTTNSGEAWFGRASDRALGSYTLQFGGASASGTFFELIDRAWSKVIFAVSAEAPTNTFKIDSSGNVGIGVGSPTSKLTLVQSSGADSVLLELQSNNDPGIRFGRSTYGSLIRHISATTDYIAFNCSGTSQPAVSATAQIIFDENGNVGVGTLTPLNKIHIAGSASVGSSYNVAAPANGLIVEGSVGIGLTNPSYKFHVSGEIYSSTYINAATYFQTNTGQIKSDTSFALLTTGNGAQSVSAKGILLGTSYDTAPGANEIRTTNNTSLYLNARGTGDIQFQTADSLKMMLLNNGNLGIGTATPVSKFVVNGGTVNTTTYTTSEARISDASLHLMKTVAGGIFESIRAMNADTTAGTTVRFLAASTSDPFNNANGGKVFIDAIRTSTNMDLAFSLNDAAGAAPVERVRFMGNGNVGIGVVSPTAKLQINNASDSRLIIYETGASPYTATLELSSQILGTYGGVIQYDGSPETLTIQNYGRTATNSIQGSILFKTKINNTTATNVMLINGFTGNVGIATLSPSEKLEVVGVIKGTSFSGAGTGLTGVASSLTAGTVTTNANLTGPITSVGNATTITDSAVTYAKIQNLNTSRVLGRISAGSGVVQELAGNDIATIIGANAVTNAVTAGTANALNTANSYQAVSLNLTGTLQFGGNINWNHGVTTELGRKTIGYNIWQGGKKLNADEDFNSGNNNITVYNNAGGTALTITRTSLATAPNSSGQVLRVSYNPGSNGTNPGFGGFFFATLTSANKVFVTRFVANIPVGRQVDFHSNAYGTNSNAYWLTNNVGTGKWEEYVFVVMCGNTGTFSSTNFFAISGGSNVGFTWDIASATVFDVTNKRDLVSSNFESYQSSNALTFNYLATNLNGNNPVPIYAFDVTSGAETRSIKAGLGYERHLTNGRGTLHIYNRSSDDTTNITGLRSSAGDIKVSIDNAGNVGVGITIPSSKLHVFNSAGSSTIAANAIAVFEQNSNAGIQVCVPDSNEAGLFFSRSGAAYYSAITRSGTDLLLKNNSSTSITINSNGNVGVGITDPTAKLDVTGSNTNGYSLLLRSGDNYNGTDSVQIAFGFANQTNYRHSIRTRHNPAAPIGGVVGNNIDFYVWKRGTDAAADLGSQFVMTMQGDGNVGIGVTNPVAVLNVKTSTQPNREVFMGDSTAVAGVFRARLDDNSLSFISLENRDLAATTDHGVGIRFNLGTNASDNAINAGGIYLGKEQQWTATASTQDSYLAFATSLDGTANEKVRIKSDGNVGIGTTIPSSKLHISNAAAATRITITDDVANGRSGYIESNYSDALVIGTTSGVRSIRFAPDNSIAMTIAVSTNNVGINVLSPNNKLAVSGSASIGSNYNTAAPTNGLIVEGRVGIGVTSPSSKLHIVTTGTNDGIILDGTSNPIFVHRTSGSDRTYLATTTNAGAFFTDAGQYDFIIRSQTNNILLGRGSGASTMAIVGNNVGIGTVVPAARLHVNSTTSGETLLRADGTNGTLFSVVDDLSDSLMSVNNSAGLPVLEVFADDRIVAGQYGANDFVLINNKLGLGTNSPAYKLDVRGSTVNARVGLMEFGAWPLDTTYIYLQNNSLSLIGANYGFLQGPTGETFVNAASGQTLHFRTGNAQRWAITSDSIFYTGTGFDASNYLILQNNTDSYGRVGLFINAKTFSAANTPSTNDGWSIDPRSGIRFRGWLTGDSGYDTKFVIQHLLANATNAVGDFGIFAKGFSTTIPAFVLTGGGSVGISTTTPAALLQVGTGTPTGTAGGIQFGSDTTARIYRVGASTIQVSNNLTVGGTITGALTGNVTGNVSGSSGSCTGNAATATKLFAGVNINGTSFDGSAAITTTNWGATRSITIGATPKNVNGGADVSWTVAEVVGYTPAYGTAVYQSKSLDSVSTPGLYQYDGAFGGTKPPDNKPNYRTIEIGNGGRWSQIALPWDNDGFFFRRQEGATYTNWRTVIHDGNYTSYPDATKLPLAGGTLTGTLTATVIKGDAGANYPHSFTNTDAGNTHWVDRFGRLLTSNGTGWQTDGRDPIMALVTSGNSNSLNIANSIGLTLHNESQTNNTFSPAITFSNRSNSGSYNTTYAAIIGRKTGQGPDSNWSAGELHFYTMPVGAYVNNIPSLIINSAGNVGVGIIAPAAKLNVLSSTSLSSVFKTEGVNGTLFEVTDDLSNSLMSVNTIGGLPVFEVFANNSIVAGQYGVNDFVISGNKIGLGTASPATKLDIYGPVSVRGTTVLTTNFDLNAGNAADIYANIRVLRGASLNDGMYIGYGGAGGNLKFFSNSGTTEFMTIATTGNVGINNTNPGYKLDVNGTSVFRDTVNIGPNIGTITWGSMGGGTGFGVRAESGRALSFGAGGNFDHLVINTNGNVGIGTTAPATVLQINTGTPIAATGGIQFGNDTGTRFYRSAPGIITCSGTIAATFSGNLTGNVTGNVSGTAGGETLGTVTGRGASTGTQISVATSAGGSMYTGTKAGAGYSDGVSGATFKSITDHPTGGSYAFAAYYNGSSGTNSFFVAADGSGYLKNSLGIGTSTPAATLQVWTGTPTASGNGIQFGDDTTARLYRSSSGVVSVSNSFAAANGYVYASNYLQTGNNLIYPSSFSATQRLEVGNAANNAWIDGLTIAPGGNVVVAGTLTESSSIRYKENIQTIIAPILSKLNEIRPVTYNKKDNPNNIEYGIIAEELNDLFPEFVNKNDKGEVESVNYSRLTVLLIKAVKELKEEIEILKNK